VTRDVEQFPIAGHGRQRLLETAAELLDRDGIDGCSARAIATAAGHRNVAAVNYHFGNREQLVRAVLTSRSATLDAQRHVLLDDLEANGDVTPRDALAATLAPLVALLDEPAGRRHLRLINQAANHPAYFAHASIRSVAGAARGAAHLAPLLHHVPPATRPQRAQHVFGMTLYALAEQARLLDTDPPPRPVLDTATFTTDLIDIVIGALSA